MKNFLIGLGLGVTGLTAAIVFGLLGSLKQADEFIFPVWPWVFFGLGLCLVILGPLYFWLISPLRNRLRRPGPGHT